MLIGKHTCHVTELCASLAWLQIPPEGSATSTCTSHPSHNTRRMLHEGVRHQAELVRYVKQQLRVKMASWSLLEGSEEPQTCVRWVQPFLCLRPVFDDVNYALGPTSSSSNPRLR